MRKIILIIGVISLIACSDQAYQENRMPNGVVTGTDPKALNNRIKPNTYVPDEYFSPWDINNLLPVQYYFQCHLLSHKSVYVRVTPFIGLAYYDGIDDGTYNMSTGAFNLTSGTYPNGSFCV